LTPQSVIAHATGAALVVKRNRSIASLPARSATRVIAEKMPPANAKIAKKLASVLCGGAGGASREVTEDAILELEREAFVSLCGEPKSQERMQSMLMNNKPLRN